MILSAFQTSRLISKAENGDLAAQLKLGEMYLKGKDVEPSITEAIKYYSLAARQDHPDALFFIAECQDLGRGTVADPNFAFQNYLRAAKLGHVEACMSVAYCYEVGRGTYQNKESARQYYGLAFEQGHPEALIRLAELEKSGDRASSTSPLDRARMGLKL